AGMEGPSAAWRPDLGFARVAPAVLELTGEAAAAFESLGCHVEVVNPGWENLEEVFSTLIAAQFYAAWADELPAAEPRLDPALVRFIRRGGSITARDYLRARARVAEYWEEVRAFSERFDLLLTPTTAVAPFAAGDRPPRDIDGEATSVLGWMPFTYPFNLTGQPAVSVPAAPAAHGRPA